MHISFLNWDITGTIIQRSLNYKNKKNILYVCDHMKGLIKILVVKQVVEFYNASFDSVLSTDDINKLLRKREL